MTFVVGNNAGGFALERRPLDAQELFGDLGRLDLPMAGDRAVESRSAVPITFAVPAGALVASAKVVVLAAPPGWTPVRQVAEVRDDVNGCLVVDFGRMRTVRGIRLSTDDVIEKVLPWLGSQFANPESIQANAPESEEEPGRFDFSELNTERLLVKVGTDAATFTAHAQVLLSSAPADLELLIEGQRAWFQPGEAKRGRIGLAGVTVNFAAIDYFATIVDVTALVAAAAARKPNVTGELRAATPGLLGVDPRLSFQRVHTVQFPEGAERVASLAAEGPATVLLPLPPVASSWTLLGLSFTVAAKLGPARVVPADGPARTEDVELVLDGEHAVAVAVDAAQVRPFGTLTAVRACVYVEAGGAELGGALLADAGGEPGAPIANGELTPLQLAAAPRAAGMPRWVTLATARPLPAPRDAPMWVALQVARGTAVVPLVATGGEVRRGLPGGPWRRFANTTTIPLHGAVRMVGAAVEGVPIDALTVAIGGAPPLALTPTADGAGALIVLDPPVAASTPGVRATAPPEAAGALVLRLVASAPAAYRFKDVQVLYRLPGDA